jgi:hypothetical protein
MFDCESLKGRLRASWQYVIATPTMSSSKRREADEIILLKKELEWVHLRIRVETLEQSLQAPAEGIKR